MREFDLELAKAGHPVQTRDGKEVRIICWDAKYGQYPIIALVKNPFDSSEHPDSYTIDGHYTHDEDGSELDLVMATEKHEGWINLYKDKYNDVAAHRTVYDSEERAFEAIDTENYFKTVKIEWEE